MDKNTIIGLLLIAGILFTFTLVTEPEPVDEETKTETVVEDGLNNNVVVVDSAKLEVSLPVINLDSVPDVIKENPEMLKAYTDSLEMVEKIKKELSQSAAQKDDYSYLQSFQPKQALLLSDLLYELHPEDFPQI